MTVSIELQMEQMGQRAKKAARVLSAAAPAAKTQALRALAALLIERQPDILKANALDVNAAKAANMTLRASTGSPSRHASWRIWPMPVCMSPIWLMKSASSSNSGSAPTGS